MSVERTLIHFPLDPASRQVRLALGEKRLPFADQVEKYWEGQGRLHRLNPSGLPPVLVENRHGREVVLCEARAILDHLEERHPEYALLPDEPQGRAEVRRLMGWFDRKFTDEVNGFLLHEKMEKRLLGLGAPELAALRRGRESLRDHLRMMEGLLNTRDWLAASTFSLADIAAAAHLSVIDYMGEAPWEDFPATRLWYVKAKSRPSFRPLLADRFPGLPPAAHYDDLDF